jgi:DNA mismatch repair ATPase MutS
MKLKALLAIFVTAALGLTAAFAAEDDTPLTKEMKTVNKSLRTLKRQVADSSKKDDNLQLLATIKKSLDAASKLEPSKTKDQPAGEKAAYLEKFHKELTELGKTFDQVEVAVKADKPVDAKKIFEKLSEQKEKGHKDFGVDEDK